MGSELSAFGVCSSWAEVQQYKTQRAGRPDTFRATIELLQLSLEGRLGLSLEPPGFLQENFVDHPDVLSLRELLGRTHPSEESEEDDTGTGSDQESEEESEGENMREDKEEESRSEENSSEEVSSEEY